MFEAMSFKARITALVLAAMLAVLLVSAVAMTNNSMQLSAARRQVLVATIDSAHSTVAAFVAKARSGKMEEATAKAAAIEALLGARYGKDDYFYIWTMDGVSVLHPFKPEWKGQSKLGQIPDGKGGDVLTTMIGAVKAAPDGKAFVETYFPRPGQTAPVLKLQYLKVVPEWGWMVGTGLYMDDLQAEMRAMVWKSLAFVGAVMLVLGTLATRLARHVLRQLGGDPAVAAGVVGEVAQGHLDVRIPAAPAGSLLADLGQMVASLRQTVARVHESTASVDHAASEIAAGNSDLSSRTEQTASNLQQTASAMEQLTGTVVQTAEAARTASQLAASAAEVAQRGGAVVSEVVATMDEINHASERMSDIIGAIDGISFQTNILALNAAVEAARAGEQGRGFAVVASEVRSLAGRSAEAAKEIKQLITASMEKAGNGARLVGNAGQTMQELVASVNRVTDIVGEISTATQEQSQGLGSINRAVAGLEEMTQRNAALVEESAAAAQSLRDQSQLLSGAVSRFRFGAQGVAV
ncbi:MAG TPA: methyl-accepting chemotaxis protein [Rubrivivax sp.]|nr:methyl-accepting chemotaxis protein [Rubrivivax sp.]